MRKERLDVFEKIINIGFVSKSNAYKALFSLLYTNEDFGRDGIKERNSISIRSFKVDLCFSYPLKIYTLLTDLGMSNIEKSLFNNQNNEDGFINDLNIFGKTIIYSHLISIYDFLRYPVDMMPRIDHCIIHKGLIDLYKMMYPLQFKFIPDKIINSNLNYVFPDKNFFIENNERTAWYICSSDIIWTKPLIGGTKSCLSSVCYYPIYFVIKLVERCTQRFFEYYISGIRKLNKKLSVQYELTKEELIILNMMFGLDIECYNNHIEYHKRAGLLDNEYYNNMKVFVDNIILLNLEVKEILYSVKEEEIEDFIKGD